MLDKLWDESPRVQQMKKQFREEAQQEARKEAQREAKKYIDLEMEKIKRKEEKARQEAEDLEIKIRRKSLISVTRVRFPKLAEFARQQVKLFNEPEILDLLMQQIAVAPNISTARLLLKQDTEILDTQ